MSDFVKYHHNKLPINKSPAKIRRSKTFVGMIQKYMFFCSLQQIKFQKSHVFSEHLNKSGTQPQGQLVPPRLYQNFQMPEPYFNQGGQILPNIAEVTPKISCRLHLCKCVNQKSLIGWLSVYSMKKCLHKME